VPPSRPFVAKLFADGSEGDGRASNKN